MIYSNYQITNATTTSAKIACILSQKCVKSIV